MRITEAAQRLGTSPRMLRYRDALGLLPPVREGHGRAGHGGGRGGGGHGGGGHGGGHGGTGQSGAGRGGAAHRQFGDAELDAVGAALRLEQRYDISPAALAFGLRVLADPSVRAAVTDLGRRVGRLPSPPERALDFEKERALRLLSGPPRAQPRRRRPRP